MAKSNQVRIRQITLLLILFVVVIQLTTALLMVAEVQNELLFTFHAFCGFILFFLVAVHILIFRKNLKHYLFPEKKM
jgi:hypothetical protein